MATTLKQYYSNAHPQSFYDALAWEGLMGKALPGQSFNYQTGLYPLSTVAWLAVPQAERLAIVNTITTFDESNPSNPCN
ncbi:MAG TPA: hypothetical protein VFR70_03850 [Flavobacterium sp.]|nr:hypothetical protein [Flavobacterium sp.]